MALTSPFKSTRICVLQWFKEKNPSISQLIYLFESETTNKPSFQINSSNVRMVCFHRKSEI